MLRFQVVVVLLSIVSGGGWAQDNPTRCLSEILLERTLESMPEKEDFLRERALRLQAWRLKNIAPRTVIRIPVVVHVVWFDPAENISEEQIRSQIDVVNTDFQALNCELKDVPEEFRSVIANVGFEFCLASVDPEGKPTNGIVRTPTFIPRFSSTNKALFHSDMGGSDAWDSRYYLNIWVANLGMQLGYASFPGMNVDPKEEGVVINYTAFGTVGTVERPYHLGRTLTHEMGHYFNLNHPFPTDIKDTCFTDDGVLDTPFQGPSYGGTCPKYPQFSCGSSDMFMNFMNYSDDPCLNMFTEGQKQKMLDALNAFRPALAESTACEYPSRAGEVPEFQIQPNPAIHNFSLKKLKGYLPGGRLRIFTSTGKMVFQQKDWPLAASLDVSNWSAGIYVVEFTCGHMQWVGRLIKV